MDQRKAPVYEALQEFRRNRVVPFDVPGHKRGRGNPELVALLGKQCVELDVNSMKPLDNLCHPISVIKEAEELAAEAQSMTPGYKVTMYFSYGTYMLGTAWAFGEFEQSNFTPSTVWIS